MGKYTSHEVSGLNGLPRVYDKAITGLYQITVHYYPEWHIILNAAA